MLLVKKEFSHFQNDNHNTYTCFHGGYGVVDTHKASVDRTMRANSPTVPVMTAFQSSTPSLAK